MKWFREHESHLGLSAVAVLLTAGLGATAGHTLRDADLLFSSGHGLGRWIDNVEGGSDAESALFRLMKLPGGEILFRRPPSETVPALTALQKGDNHASLYSLRALEEEQALNFDAAERDWKAWAEQSPDSVAAHLDLADFYARRLQPRQEIAALEVVGNAPASAEERWTAPEQQRAWLAWERILKIVDRDALPRADAAQAYAALLDRYPQQKSAYARQFAFLLTGSEFASAKQLIARYRATFPADSVYPIKAEADLATRQGSAKDGLAVYERSFEPLWPAELVKNYYDLILADHAQRRFADELRARLAANPDNLKDAARLFYLYQQQGQLDSAKAVLASYREQKAARGAQWSTDELFTFGQLLEAIQDFPDAARFDYALASDRKTPGAEQKGLIGLTRILLTAPEQPLRVGAGNLALYKNIATMDRGPGYLNGILSLLLNSQGPRDEYSSEDQLATPYFHRARAAELLAEIDKRFPSAPERAALHEQLMEAYAAYGENAAIIREGTALLAQFPDYPDRVKVALEIADAYARTSQTEKELALYRSLLNELSAKADGVPLGSSNAAYSMPVDVPQDAPKAPPQPAAQNASGGENSASAAAVPVQPASTARSAQYSQVLDRALARYVALERLPDALTLLRGELDRNLQDPGLYQRLADFLDQNALNARQEEVYQAAIQQFQDPTWYAKLARFYLRAKRGTDYTALTHKVAGIFSGTELEQYLNQAPSPGRALALQVNLYAHQRFPHDLRFVENLLYEYRRTNRRDDMEKLLWEHWTESPLLRGELFELLSTSGRLDVELDALRQQDPEIDTNDWTALSARNPATERFFMDLSLWQSHYEAAAGAAEALAAAYPANRDLGEQTSSLYRSLAYFHPEDTDKAVVIEKRLLDFDPGNLDTLARIGDIYADRERFSEAVPFFLRMADAHPGDADGYLQSATVFWDYFDFPSALAQLRRGRERLAQPTLFGYQIGAIEESRGNVDAAIHEYASSAASDTPSAESRDRLLTLARRSDRRSAVEDATAGLLRGNAPSTAAIQLRASVLLAQHRKEDLDRELKQAVAQTASFDVLDALTESARTNALPEVEEAALRRQIALTSDPVRNLQLRYQLVDFYGLHKPQSAAAEVEAIYRENGKILGVVRATVDYDWAHDRKPQAVAALLESANASYPDLKDQFQLEAARKLTELADYPKSRALLEALLARKPLDAASEASLAENYARAGDQTGLAAFYKARLGVARQASLDPVEKQQRVAQLRRGMIGAATQLANFNDATDQYIELINSYPDDAALAQEAALFAVAHGERDRLIGFYQKTIADSPRDPHWSIVLARLATAAENYPMAIDAYDKAIHLRPERQDLLSAQADLDEKLHRLDEANFDYRKLYVLSYRDPKWMVKVAELCTRQGHDADGVKALEAGLIEGRPVKAANSFAVAERLESWGMLDDARKYAELGITQAGDDLLVDGAAQNGAATYARILSRQRQASAAYTRLTEARAQAVHISLGAVAMQVIKQGPGAVTDEEWRKQRITVRGNAATQGFAQAIKAIGDVAGKYYTPEEKMQFAAWIQNASSGAAAQELRAVYLPAIQAAGLEDLNTEISWTLAQRQRNQELPAWIELQQRRGQIETAAARLEKLAAEVPARQRPSVLGYARDAFHKAGDFVGELRVTQRLAESTKLDGDQRARYYQLLLARQPQQLQSLAASEDSAAEYLVRNGSADQALPAVAARAANKLPVWRTATTALAGLYLRDPRPEVGSAFASALGSEASIGERVALPVDRNQQLAGEIWFYYGSRYAEYLDLQKDPRAEDYLESELEHTPESSDAYLRLADYSAQTNRADAALIDYRNSLDLKHDQPAALDNIASILWTQGKKTEALAAWSEAVQLLTSEIDARRVPESFWPDFTEVLGNVSAHGQYDSIQKQVDALLRIYIPRNGYYRVDSLLEAGYKANHNSIDWLLDITSSAHDQQVILNMILPNNWDPNSSTWIQKEHRGRILARIVELEEHAAQQNSGEGGENTYNRRRWCEELILEKDFAAARAVLAKLPESVRRSGEWLPDVLAVADWEGNVSQLLEGWKHDAATAPAANDLRSASAHLSDKGRRAVLRFVYERALDARELTAPNFLGLAAIHLDENDTPGAMSLLRRMTLVSANLYADMNSAAALLETQRHFFEAVEFLRPLADAEPWNAGYKVRLAAAMLAANPSLAEALAALAAIAAVAADPMAPYVDRIVAAKALKGHGAPASGSGELQLLAQQACPTLDDASKPFFMEARIAAAACISAPKSRERLLHEALAIAPNSARIRLQYVWAAFAAGFDSRALVAAEPYLQYAPYYYGNTYLTTGEDSGAEGDGTVENADVSQLQWTPNLSLSSLSDADAARLCTLAIKAWERRHDSLEAVHLAQRALRRIKDPALRQPFQQTYDRLNLDFVRAHENDARAPAIGPQVEWDKPESNKTVRPRLLPGMPFSPKPEINKELE